MLPKLFLAFITSTLLLFYSSTLVSAAELCPSNYPVCSLQPVLGQDCLSRETAQCLGPGFDGNWCCRAGTPLSTPTPTSNPNAGNCVQNGNYCVPAAVECDVGHTPGQGGVCPGSGICCNRAVTPSPTPSSSGSTFTLQPPRSPVDEGFDRFRYPCSSTANPEFNPLRPYPGSPCDPLIPKSWPEKQYISFACGKSLNVGDTVSLARNFPTGGDLPSNPTPGVVYWCDSSHTQACVVRQFDYDVKIDLSGATIPILGNTQDSLDDATRVNQYLISYLSGTVQQAEQIPLDKNDPAAISRLINFAGPLKKLLSFDSQNRIKSDLVIGPRNSQYHNYAVGCQKGLSVQYFIDLFTAFFSSVQVNISQLPGFLITSARVAGGLADLVFHFPSIAADLANALQSATATDAVGMYNYLQNAVDQIPDGLLNDLSNLTQYMTGYFGRLGNILEVISLDAGVACSEPGSVIKRLSDFTNNTYPDGELPPDPNDYDNFNEFWDNYNNWRGLTNVWLIGPQDIGFNPFVNESVWAQLFKNVPFTTLEDTMGEFTVSVMDSSNQQPEGVITGNPNKPITLTISGGDSRISVPHVRAINALSQLLQNITLPRPTGDPLDFDQDQTIGEHQAANQNPEPQKIEVVTNPIYCNPRIPLIYNSFLCNNSSVVPPSLLEGAHVAPPPLFTSHDSICDLKDIRINPGDYLYGQNVTAKLTYYQQFSYEPPGAADPNCQITCGASQGTCCGTGSCNLRAENRPELGYYCAANTVTTNSEGRVAVFSKIPLIDQIYDKLVAGKQSIFRRFLHAQECEPNCSAEARKHYIRQDAETIPAAIGATYTGDGTVTAGDKTGGGQIYIPRLGSLFDYFLGAANENFNLQKMLRPKGFGGTGVPGLVSVPGSCQVPQAGLCSLNDPQTQLLNNFPTSANTAAHICGRESNGGNALAINDGCLENPVWNTRIHTADYSVGLFQINMLSHPRPAFLNIPEGASLKAAIAAIGRAGKTCYQAFSNWEIFRDPDNYDQFCEVGDQTLLNTCVQWFQNPANNVAYARNMSGGGANWSPWATYTSTLQCQP